MQGRGREGRLCILFSAAPLPFQLEPAAVSARAPPVSAQMASVELHVYEPMLQLHVFELSRFPAVVFNALAGYQGVMETQSGVAPGVDLHIFVRREEEFWQAVRHLSLYGVTLGSKHYRVMDFKNWHIVCSGELAGDVVSIINCATNYHDKVKFKNTAVILA